MRLAAVNMGKVISLVDGPTLIDIPAQLRQLALDIESGKYGDVEAAVTVTMSGNRRHVFGHGAADTVLSLALLARGQFDLCATA